MEVLNTERKVPSKDDSKNIIRKLGLKVTDQRLLILKEVISGPAHVTAQALFERVSHKNLKKDSPLGFATVYRFLRKLTEQGYLTELRMRGLPARYEWALKRHHDHISCLRCGMITEFENQQIEDLQKQIAQKLKYKLTDHILELYGYCEKCQSFSNQI